MNRDDFKQACLTILDGVASEHPVGHQGKLAARYLMRTGRGDSIELMFEKGAKTPPNLWIGQRHVGDGMLQALESRMSPAASLYQTADQADKPRYGRHSALRPMRQLANADLVCIHLRTLGELERILARLKISAA